MTRTNVDSSSLDAQAKEQARPEHADTQTHLLALLPSAGQLRKLAAGQALTTSGRPATDAGHVTPSLRVPEALLNPLESLPDPPSIFDVKKQVHDSPALGTRGKPITP